MKALKTIVFLSALVITGFRSVAQQKISIASNRALKYADSLVHAFRSGNWNDYLNISYPGVVSYYGGRQGFKDYIERIRSFNNSIREESPEKLQMIQIIHQTNEWQCVIEKVRHTTIDGKPADIISYLVGQSKDGGKTWKYFDMALNSVQNVMYIMPDKFDTLAVPRRQIVFDDKQMARQYEQSGP